MFAAGAGKVSPRPFLLPPGGKGTKAVKDCLRINLEVNNLKRVQRQSLSCCGEFFFFFWSGGK